MEQRGLGPIVALLVVGIIISMTGVFGGPGSLFGGDDVNVPEPTEAFYVYDTAGVLSQETENYIVAKNISLYDGCGAQAVIVCVGTTGATPITDFAKEIFSGWGIGDRAKNNGVLLLLAVDDNDYYMLQGEGIKSSFPSGEIKLILTESLEPGFAEGNYDAAVRETFDRIIDHYEAAYGITVVESTDRTALSGNHQGSGGESSTGISISRKDIADLGMFVVKSVMTMIKIVIIGLVLIIIGTILLIVFLVRMKRKNGGRLSIGDAVADNALPKKNVNPYSSKMNVNLKENKENDESVKEEKEE